MSIENYTQYNAVGLLKGIRQGPQIKGCLPKCSRQSNGADLECIIWAHTASNGGGPLLINRTCNIWGAPRNGLLSAVISWVHNDLPIVKSTARLFGSRVQKSCPVHLTFGLKFDREHLPPMGSPYVWYGVSKRRGLLIYTLEPGNHISTSIVIALDLWPFDSKFDKEHLWAAERVKKTLMQN
jgi:hypothetical protein